MIERYTLPKMGSVWTEEVKFQKMLDVEVAVCEAFAHKKVISKSVYNKIKKNAKFNIKKIKQIEEKTNHDVAAFVSNVQESLGDNGRYIHMGLTSNDVTDTALALQLKDASEIILNDIENFIDALAEKAKLYRHTPMIGRTHGIHAEPTTFGLKIALFCEEMKRNRQRMIAAKESVCVGKISGAVGTFSNIDPSVEKYVCDKLGIKSEPVATQVVQRDRHAGFLNTIAITAATIEKLATEIRGLQRTEVREVEEYFSPTQKGSSAMPHKRNPITSERMCGMARILRANALAGIENIALWHERDISHSSVERVVMPDSTILIDYMLNKMSDIIKHLLVYPKKMLQNLNITKGLIFSQRVLIELMQRGGVSRDKAYELVQRNAMKTWQNDGNDFKSCLMEDREVNKILKSHYITACFDLKFYLKNVDKIFKRIKL